MSYKIDGSSHTNGVLGENSVLEFFNNPKNYNFIKNSISKILNIKNLKPFNFEQRGGTTDRKDIYDVENNIKISIKSKKFNNNKYHGTFDLINTSKIKDFINDINDECMKAFWEYEKCLINFKRNNQTNENIIRNEVNKKINGFINTITGDIIIAIFKKIIILEDNIIDIIRDYKNSTNEKINESDIHFLRKDWIQNEIKKIDENQIIKTNKKSVFIKNKDNSNGIFRLRVALNNGINALMVGLKLKPKTKGKNNSSCLTFKIQVDKVMEVIRKYDVNRNK